MMCFTWYLSACFKTVWTLLAWAVLALHFKWHTFAFHPDEEVQLKARVLQEVVQALLLLVKSVCHQILEDGAFESSQVALQDIRPGPRAQHLDEQTDICRVNLEHIVFGIALPSGDR